MDNPGTSPFSASGGSPSSVPPPVRNPAQLPYDAGSVGMLIGEGIRLYRRNFWTYFVVMLVAQGFVVLCVGFWEGLAAAPLPRVFPGANLRVPLMIGGGLFAAAVSFVAQTVAQGTLAVAMTANLLERPMSGPEAFVRVTPSLPRLLGVSFLGTLIIMLGFLFCIVPGIIFMFGYFLMSLAVVVEGARPIEALRRSWTLMYRKTEKGFFSLRANSAKAAVIVLYSFAVSIGASIASAVVVVPMHFLADSASVPVAPAVLKILQQAVQGIAAAFVTPLSSVPVILLYYDIRRRFEGLNLAAAARLSAQAGLDDAADAAGMPDATDTPTEP
jgi:hypothetical protein